MHGFWPWAVPPEESYGLVLLPLPEPPNGVPLNGFAPKGDSPPNTDALPNVVITSAASTPERATSGVTRMVTSSPVVVRPVTCTGVDAQPGSTRSRRNTR